MTVASAMLDTSRLVGGVFVLVCSVTAISGCHEPSAEQAAPPAAAKTPAPSVVPETTIVFSAGPRRVTLAELARVMGPPPQQRLRVSESERRRDFLERFERTELLALAADERGYFREPAIVASRKRQQVEGMLSDLFGPRGTQIAQVTDADVRAYYDANVERWGTPEQVRARHILLRDRKTAERVLAMLLAKPENAATFPNLAREHSVDERTRERGGDLGRFSRHAPTAQELADAVSMASVAPPVVPEAVRAAAFALERPFAIAPSPIKSELGYHVVQLLARHPAARTQLAQVSYVIGEQLRKERMATAVEDFTAGLEKRANVRVNDAALARVRIAP